MKHCEKNTSPFMTIRQTAATGLVSEHHLRLRLKQGRLPGFYSGKWYWIDFPALVDLLHEEARANVVDRPAAQ